MILMLTHESALSNEEGKWMSVSAVSSLGSIQNTPSVGKAADGDSLAVEAAESAATKQAETANGGFAPKASSANGGVDKRA
jgi:hypothetical protein